MNDKKKDRNILLIALLVLLVVTTGAFIGTLARYVTSKTASDSAKVAKFGLNLPATLNLFSDSYSNVKADADGKKIIAPGTSGSYSFNVGGTSEVAYKVSANVTATYSDAWDGYEPLEFSLDGLTWTDLAEFKTNLSAALASETISPNTAYSSNQTIHWRWPFHVSTENDIKDTNVGMAAAEGAALNVTIRMEMTAAQVG